MSSRSSHQKSSSSSSSYKNSSSSSKPKQASGDDWSDVNDPEQRRRIQNRIAQRRFRERARDQREQSERDSRNMRHAEVQYRTADPDELGFEDEEQLDGLPWGGPSMRHIVSRGVIHERSRGGARHGDSSRNHHHSSGNNSGGSSGSGSHYYADDYDFHDYDDGQTVVPVGNIGSESGNYQHYSNTNPYGQGVMAGGGFDDGFVSAFDQSVLDYGSGGRRDADGYGGYSGGQDAYRHDDEYGYHGTARR